MRYILLIDSSADKLQIGLAGDGQLLFALSHPDRQSQAAALNPAVADICKQANIELKDIAAFAVCSGPGSYTGLRIGMAAAKGFSFALNKPLIVNHKLELLAEQIIAHNEDYWQYGILITARAGEFFYAAYDAEMNLLQGPLHAAEADVRSMLEEMSVSSFLLSGDENAQKTFGENVAPAGDIDMEVWAGRADQNLTAGIVTDAATAEPFYMKEVYIYPAKQK